MQQSKTVLFSFLLLCSFPLISQSYDAEEVLSKSIKYHDPNGKWGSAKFHLPLFEGRPNGNYRLTDIKLDNRSRVFEYTQIRGKDRVSRYLSPDSCGVEWNYQSDIKEEIQKKFRLHCDGGNEFFRNYYAYLYGLPMKLKDPGTIIDPKVKKKDFFGEELLELRVTYDSNVGEDIWYFYFDPETFALSGYRFYHDEKKNDGEYILLEGEITINGIKFPEKRAWYTHKEGKYLGNDDLLPYAATKY